MIRCMVYCDKTWCIVIRYVMYIVIGVVIYCDKTWCIVYCDKTWCIVIRRGVL